MLCVIVMVTCWASEPAFFLGDSIADSPTEVVLSVFSYMEEDEGGGIIRYLLCGRCCIY